MLVHAWRRQHLVMEVLVGCWTGRANEANIVYMSGSAQYLCESKANAKPIFFSVKWNIKWKLAAAAVAAVCGYAVEAEAKALHNIKHNAFLFDLCVHSPSSAHTQSEWPQRVASNKLLMCIETAETELRKWFQHQMCIKKSISNIVHMSKFNLLPEA